MRIDYAVSSWNYTHYAKRGPLEQEAAPIVEQGLGAEFWNPLWDGTDLNVAENCAKARALFDGLPISWHGRRDETQTLERQIDTLHSLGGSVIVIHRNFFADDAEAVARCRDLVAYGAKRNVLVALENGTFDMIAQFLKAVDGLKFCLDTGHAVMEKVPLRQYVTEFGEALCHLHIQDTLPDEEKHLPGVAHDHYTLGTGATTAADWQGFRESLEAVNFEGMGVYEIRPRLPQHTAYLSIGFMHKLLGS